MDKKLGIIVPYRNRHDQLELFKKIITSYLEKTGIKYELIIVEQDNAKLFNRGMILNIGFKIAEKLKCNYVVFHDVDMIPIDVDYSYSDIPLHLATKFENNDREIFDSYFGGVTMFTIEDFKTINGYSNKYWGWGFEDDDLLLRCKKHNIGLNHLYLPNTDKPKSSLKFNGDSAYVIGKNVFDINKDLTFFVSFKPDNIICDHLKPFDNYNVFTIPGYDLSISYNSFFRYNVCLFDNKQNAYYVNSNIKMNYNTNICVTIDNTLKIIKVYQDGDLIGTLNGFNKIYPYNKEPNFYLGSAKPGDGKYFKGFINSFIVYSSILSNIEIKELSDGNNISSNNLVLHYDSSNIKNYKLTDLSGNQNDGKIIKCEILNNEFNRNEKISIPHRRECLFKSLPHEENGFLNNRWKDDNTRWNQLRFINEVSMNDELLNNDGLSDLQFVEHGRIKDKNITHLTVGI